MKYLNIPFILLISLFGLAACDNDGPAEQFGEQIDQAADEIGDQAEEAADEAEEAADRLAN